VSNPRRLGRHEVERLLSSNGLSPRKSLGQNFVVDPNAIDRIVRLAGVGPRDYVVEIGAGLGSLTFALEQTGAHIVAFEIDANLAAIVRQSVGSSVMIIEHDALSADIESLLGGAAFDDDADHTDQSTTGDRSWILVANLPYNIATPLVMTILESVGSITRMMVMVQREVAERFVAVPSRKAYGAVSVRIAYFASTRIVGRVPKEVFFPQPHVESALVEIVRRSQVAIDPSICSYDEFSALVRSGFSQRRKMLRRSLAGLVDEEAFACAAIDSSLRAENLDVNSWGKLAGCQRVISNSLTPS
jgi:16S rRNA (adenine1518-N6/adenine1519-N6)-dimethyltransferase